MAEFDYQQAHKRLWEDSSGYADAARRAFDEAVDAYKFGLGSDQALYADIFFKPLRQQLENVLAGRRVTEPT